MIKKMAGYFWASLVSSIFFFKRFFPEYPFYSLTWRMRHLYVLNFFTQEYGMSFLFFLISQQTIAHWPDLAMPIHLHTVYSCFHAATAVEQSIHRVAIETICATKFKILF